MNVANNRLLTAVALSLSPSYPRPLYHDRDIPLSGAGFTVPNKPEKQYR